MKRVIKTVLMVFFFYLVQVCAMHYLAIGGITANILVSAISVIIVAYGRYFAFGAGAIASILMEIMTASVSYLYLVLYVVSAMACSIPFADKSERRLEMERTTKNAAEAKNMPPLVRTILCTVLFMLIFEVVHCAYSYLQGYDITARTIGRALFSVSYTTAVTAVIMLPCRKFLGVKKSRKKMPAVNVN